MNESTPGALEQATAEAPLTRPDTYCWSGPLKQSNCHQIRDFVVITLIASAIVYSALALGLI